MPVELLDVHDGDHEDNTSVIGAKPALLTEPTAGNDGVISAEPETGE